MTAPPQWALDRAWEWLAREGVKLSGYSCVLDNPWVECDDQAHASLAALLVRVAADAQIAWAPRVKLDTLDEVRRVVEEVAGQHTAKMRVGISDTCLWCHECGQMWPCWRGGMRDEILARLEKL